MRYFLVTYSVLAVAMVGGMSLVAAQNRSSAAKPWKCIGCSVDGKTTPRTPDGRPDLNGYWNPERVSQHVAGRSADGSVLFDFGGAQLTPEGTVSGSTPDLNYATTIREREAKISQPSYNPEYAAKAREIADNHYFNTQADDPMFECIPYGVPRGAGPRTMQIVQTADVVAILYEAAPGPLYRLIYTDGRQHPDDLETSHLGHSIGHWEGDALVVDVLGLSDDTWLGGGFTGPRYANIHSDKLHVIERWTRNGDDLLYEATVEDPVMFTKPWVITPKHNTHADANDRGYLFGHMCVPNDVGHIARPTKEDPGVCNYCTVNPNIVGGHSIGGKTK